MYGVVANYVCMSNFQLCYSPSTYLQTSVLLVLASMERIPWTNQEQDI